MHKASLLQKMQNLLLDLDEADEKDRIVKGLLVKLYLKLRAQHTHFDSDSFRSAVRKANIIRTELLADVKLREAPQTLSRQTESLLSRLDNNVCLLQDAGRRVKINAILLQVISDLNKDGIQASIIPDYKFKVEDVTQFRKMLTFHGNTVDYLIVRDLPTSTTNSSLSFEGPEAIKRFSSNIYLRDQCDVRLGEIVHEATLAAAFFCRQYGLTTYKFCITDSVAWRFFVFQSETNLGPREKAAVGLLTCVRIYPYMTKLPNLLGLLKYWILNAQTPASEFGNQ